ncbi:DUF2388 domain-containing protein [Pseudomonas cavernae]|uniref:DUF2388 domain-containing protein n=1 Tax=Pseudomonas cavernae TaxID=2320867 RepID=A0A385Z7H4_9PSED|nr:DUF2388 domain-containing protein [Pseudomonas cavernae]AYC34744.1 DUF2388 domain-containing protein [Pseudomonas cavernae]
MRRYLIYASLALLAFPVGSAMADSDFWKDVFTTGATTASTYLSLKDDDKLILPAKDDASAFIASGGQIRGPYLEAALQQLRRDHPGLQASDEELATAILAQP